MEFMFLFRKVFGIFRFEGRFEVYWVGNFY